MRLAYEGRGDADPARVFRLILLPSICFACGYLLKGPPADPDSPFRFNIPLGSFLIFWGWATSLLSWGWLVCHALRLREGARLWLRIAFGAAWASGTALALACLGLCGYQWQPLVLLLLIAGPLIEYALVPASQADAGGPASWRRKPVAAAILAVTLAVFADRLASAFLAHGTTDPALYHLLGPRIWTDRGQLDFRLGAPATFHASYWEYLFIWGNVLLGGDQGRGLIEGQLFGQWTHVVFGFGGCFAAFYALFRSLGVREAWAMLAGLAGVESGAIDAYVSLAKNDLGVSMWFVSGLALVFSGLDEEPLGLWGAGLLCGLAIAGKVTVIFVAAPFLVACLFREVQGRGWRGALRRAARFALGFQIPLLVNFSRNAWFTGNPVFPLLSYRWPSRWVGPSDPSMRPVLYGWIHWSIPLFVRRWADVLRDSPLNPLVAIAPVLLLLSGKRLPRSWGSLALAAIAGISAMALWDVPGFFARWMWPSLPLLAGLAVIAFGAFADQSRWVPVRFREAIPALLLLVFVVGEWPTLIKFPTLFQVESAALAIRDPLVHPGGDSKAWLRMNVPPWELVVTTGDRLYYYVSHMNVVSANADPAIDESVSSVHDGEVALQLLRSRFDARYLINTDHFEKKYYDWMGQEFDRLAYLHPETIAYMGPNSFVLDLVKLDEAIFPECRAELAPNPVRDLKVKKDPGESDVAIAGARS